MLNMLVTPVEGMQKSQLGAVDRFDEGIGNRCEHHDCFSLQHEHATIPTKMQLGAYKFVPLPTDTMHDFTDPWGSAQFQFDGEINPKRFLTYSTRFDLELPTWNISHSSKINKVFLQSNSELVGNAVHNQNKKFAFTHNDGNTFFGQIKHRCIDGLCRSNALQGVSSTTKHPHGSTSSEYETEKRGDFDTLQPTYHQWYQKFLFATDMMHVSVYPLGNVQSQHDGKKNSSS